MRFTFPSLISASIKLARRYKDREHLVCSFPESCNWTRLSPCYRQETDWQTKASNILKFARQLISILATQVEAPGIALRLFLLAAQISDECDFEDLTYEFYVQAFSVYEESISESRAQLQAIALIIKTLHGAKVFGPDNYDTLVTQAARHGSRLLKKPHQATAVHLASHLWWQSATDADPPKDPSSPSKEKDVEGAERPKSVRIPPARHASNTHSTSIPPASSLGQ
jgi:vacuolar protein sorting-associated protein 35